MNWSFVKNLLSSPAESVGVRLSLPLDWKRRVGPLSAAWLNRTEFSLHWLRVARSDIESDDDTNEAVST